LDRFALLSYLLPQSLLGRLCCGRSSYFHFFQSPPVVFLAGDEALEQEQVRAGVHAIDQAILIVLDVEHQGFAARAMRFQLFTPKVTPSFSAAFITSRLLVFRRAHLLVPERLGISTNAPLSVPQSH
jgi:hypothetical protein